MRAALQVLLIAGPAQRRDTTFLASANSVYYREVGEPVIQFLSGSMAHINAYLWASADLKAVHF